MLLLNGKTTQAWLVLPEAIVVAVCVTYLCGALASPMVSEPASVRFRFLSLAGFLATGALIFLGGIWPSYYTILAIAALPAALVFGVAIFRPMVAWSRPKLRAYLTVCVVAAAISWAFQIYWEFGR